MSVSIKKNPQLMGIVLPFPVKFLRWTIALFFLWGTFYPLGSTENWEQWLAMADRYRLFSERGFSFVYRFSDESETTVMQVYLKNTDPSIVLGVYTAPEKLAGRKILVEGSSFWLLDKRMKDPIRISSRQMLAGQASAGDLTRLTFSENYTVIEGTRQGSQVVLELRPRTDRDIQYARIRLTLNAEDARPVQGEFFGETGVLMKRVYYEGYQQIQGKTMVVRLRIVNELNKTESRIELSSFEQKTLDSRFFSREGMKALR
ncbi:MAG TPA: outer membrane lipoprotein-sorting protein [Termitinemataceae bacterium]|nr:outer membrane lipoprotein-sorting protein [Termitinemataceae bacterium]HOM23294.1 outer membrane lipoprotein-sorting protein [Termitinemataceae bacterium]HPQ00498.1 outer membrane lipoprotein-sorting protein [Termitinemataceae bacterium]